MEDKLIRKKGSEGRGLYNQKKENLNPSKNHEISSHWWKLEIPVLTLLYPAITTKSNTFVLHVLQGTESECSKIWRFESSFLATFRHPVQNGNDKLTS